MQQYKDLLHRTRTQGLRKPNRTGIDTFGIIGAHMQYDLSQGFPMPTIKQCFWKQSIAEMIGFLRGYTNAADFRKLGCTVWDANANDPGLPGSPNIWLDSHYRQGEDDLGVIYGSQARNWTGGIDQLNKVYQHLKEGIDDRREIVSHWNPGDMSYQDTDSRMALPPCHLLYQFGIQGDELHLSMYQRSADMGLGVPFNIIGYSWLLQVMAKITGHKPGNFNHFLHDVHIYENHLNEIDIMLSKEPLPSPTLHINDDIKCLGDLETWVTLDDFAITDYKHQGPRPMVMAT